MIEKLSTVALRFETSRKSCKVFRIDGMAIFDGWNLKTGLNAEVFGAR